MFVYFTKISSFSYGHIIVHISILLCYQIKSKHLWPYIKYNNNHLNYI